MADAAERAREAVMALLARRRPAATVCPSEVARALFAASPSGSAMAGWRDAMPTVHAAVDRLVDERQVQLSWKGRVLTARTGPYRIGRIAGR